MKSNQFYWRLAICVVYLGAVFIQATVCAVEQNPEIVDRLSIEQTLGLYGTPDELLYRKYYHWETTELLKLLLKKHELSTDYEYCSHYQYEWLKMLAAVGGKEDLHYIIDYVKNQAALIQMKKKPVQVIETMSLGIAVGIMAYRKVDGADEIVEKFSTLEFWDADLMPLNLQVRDKHIQWAVSYSYALAGYRDPTVVLDKTKLLFDPQKKIYDSPNSVKTWKAIVERRLSGEEEFIDSGKLSESIKLTNEKRLEFQNRFYQLPEYIRDDVTAFQKRERKKAQ